MGRIVTIGMALAGLLAVAGVAHSGPQTFADADFVAELSGEQEVPSVETETSGEAKFILDEEVTAIDFELEVEEATDVLAVAGAHIHCAPEGENGPIVAFLAGELPGGLDGTVELKATLTGANIINDACGATLEELVDSMRAGMTYVNVHSAAHPAGEVRGQITAD